MKFLVPNYSCLQIRGLPLPDPRSLCPLSSTEFVEPPRKKIPGYATADEASSDNYGTAVTALLTQSLRSILSCK